MIVLDFYMGQEDRNEENFYFEKTGNNYQLANLFDYEISFETLKYYGNSFFLRDFDNQELCYELYRHSHKRYKRINEFRNNKQKYWEFSF